MNQITESQTSDDPRVARLRARVRALRHHIIAYFSLNILMFLIDVFSSGGTWFFWPLLFWGIGLTAHWMVVMQPQFLDTLGKDWEDRAVDRLSKRKN